MNTYISLNSLNHLKFLVVIHDKKEQGYSQDLVDGRDLEVSHRLFLPLLTMSSLVSRDGFLQDHSFQ